MNNSIVDYLKSKGEKSDYASRATLAASKGITGYSGSADQNVQLLRILTSGTPAPTATPTAQAGAKPAQTTPGVTPGAVPGQPTSVQDLKNMGFYGYSGWDDAGALADFKQTGGSGKGGPTPTTGGGSGMAGSFLNTPAINLSEMYQTLQDQSGISGLEKQLSDQTKAFTDAQSKINDNPFLSEATRVGRIAKLNTDFNANSAGTRSDIATKKADIETKLNIQTKQFDINSQQATQAREYATNLINSGAMSGASGEDIASITRATGMSSSIIKSWIDSVTKKNIQTVIKEYDDGTNQGFALINSNTGDIIKKEVIAQSKPKAGKSPTEGDKKTALQSQFVSVIESKKNDYGHMTPQDWQGALASWISRGGSRKEFIELFSQYTDPNRGDFETAYGFPLENR